MIRGEVFAIGIGVIGYLLHGWFFAIGFPILFLTLLSPLNVVLLLRMPDNASMTVWLQGAKWGLASLLLLIMLALS